jgi:hypothetical protein
MSALNSPGPERHGLWKNAVFTITCVQFGHDGEEPLFSLASCFVEGLVTGTFRVQQGLCN